MRPLTREQRLQNRAFLKALRRTGNIRLAAREVGLKYGTVQHRRRTHPAFAQHVAAALAFAQARLASGKKLSSRVRGNDGEGHRTGGGEPHLVRLPDGTIQIKRAVSGRGKSKRSSHIHPFREGDGRTQLYFIRLLGLRAGHPLGSEAVEPQAFLRAMIESYYGKTEALVDELERMLA